MTTGPINTGPLLEFRHASVDYDTSSGPLSAVKDVTLTLAAGETFGLVGESGCGKTTLSMALMGLLPSAARTSGEILFRGADLTALPEAARRELRGSQISMIFQDPATSLDPTFGVGFQVAETIRAHRDVSRKEAKARALSLLTEVGIPDAAARYADPPHRLSGGMRQRVVLAAALANEPALLLADEPTTALDVTIQAQILDLLAGLQREHGTTILLIGHDLGVIAQVCDRVGVMYAGMLVEVAATTDLFAAPRHPYTRALLAALPTRAHGPGRLPVIPGQVPDLTRPPSGCRFKERCPSAMAVCDTEPVLTATADGHSVACWLSTDVGGAANTVGEPATMTLEGGSDD